MAKNERNDKVEKEGEKRQEKKKCVECPIPKSTSETIQGIGSTN